MQLELAFWPRDSVRQVLSDFLAMRAEGITRETLDLDYRVRMEWLCEVFGPATPMQAVTYQVIDRVARESRIALADVTIRMRLNFWVAAVEYRALQETGFGARPGLPPWLKRRGRQMHDFYTPEQFKQFRLALPPNKLRRFADLAMWTGQHTRDVESMQGWMLEPDYDYALEGAERRGRWWRRNHKNKKCVATWIPMEPELRELALEWKVAGQSYVCGPVHNKSKYFALAAERTELPPIRANLGLRASHSSELLARNYTYEYVRLVLGHQGEIRAEARADGPDGNRPIGGPRAVTGRPSVLSGHYLRPSPNTLRPQG